MKGEVEAGRSRNAEVVQEPLQLRRVVASQPGCANQLKEPDRCNKGPLHVKDLLRPADGGAVFNPKVDPDGEMSMIPDREVALERREEFARRLQRLPRRSTGRIGGIWH